MSMTPAPPGKTINEVVTELSSIRSAITGIIQGIKHQQQVLRELGDRMSDHEFSAEYRIKALEEWKQNVTPLYNQISTLTLKIELITSSIDATKGAFDDIRQKDKEQDVMMHKLDNLRHAMDLLQRDLMTFQTDCTNSNNELREDIKKHGEQLKDHGTFIDRVGSAKKLLISMAIAIAGLVTFANTLKDFILALVNSK